MATSPSGAGTADSRIARRLARLRARLAKQIALTETTVTLPRSEQTYTILLPSNHDQLLDAATDDPEQNLPYWAEVWPSGVALADVVLALRERVASLPVLELGSGLGITTTAALQAGARPLAADYSAASLTLCVYNGLRNAGREPGTITINWRAPADKLLARADALRGFPLILAADVLYEQRDVEPLLALAGRILRPGGLLWLAEPGRAAARRFLTNADSAGWTRESSRHDGPWPDRSGVTVGMHFLRRPD